jgi:hypothetical protein
MEYEIKKFEKMFGKSRLKHLSLHPLFKSSVLKYHVEGARRVKKTGSLLKKIL